MFYAILKPLPRPAHFPVDPRLEELLTSFAPDIGYFKLPMKRRSARDLRKGIFGPQGLKNVPDCDGGVREFDLPNGWMLRLTYYETYGVKAGDVDAEFIPPASRKLVANPKRGALMTVDC
jgi:hypothetical protein